MLYPSDNNYHKKMDESDFELWTKTGNGDSTAFEIIFKKYYQNLYQFAGRFILDAQTAENVVQEMFVTLWTEREKLQIKSSLKSYLFTAVRNRSINQIRQQKIRDTRKNNNAIEQDESKNPENEYIDHEFQTAVHAAIRKLPNKCRQIYLMKRYDNLKYDEIAEILDISVNTVKTQLKRALALLQKHLAHLLNSPLF